MEFKIDLKNVETLFIEKGKIITNKNGKKIEYIFENNVITEVNPYDESRIAEEKINELLEKNGGVKKINAIMRMADKCHPNDPTYADQAFNYRQAEDPTIGRTVDIEKAKQIVDLDKIGVLDEIAEKNREKIAQNLSSLFTEDEKKCDGECKCEKKDKESKIKELKELIEKLEKEV